MVIPNYLSSISKKIKETQTEVEVQIVCPCGNTHFSVFENIISQEEQNKINQYEKIVRKYNEFYRDSSSGTLYLVHRNIFGKITSKIVVEALPKVDMTKAIKIQCSNCEKQYIIFDSRLHGYNAVLNPITTIPELEFKQKKFKSSISNQVSITIELSNELSYKVMKSEINEFSLEDYSHSFSTIRIQGKIMDLNEKKVILLFEETD